MPNPYANAATWFVGRPLDEGAGDGIAFEDPHRALTRGGLATATRGFAEALANSIPQPQ